MSEPLCRWSFTEAPASRPTRYRQAIHYGAAKFNVGTILKKTFLEGIRESALALDAAVNVHDVIGSHREQDYLLEGKRRMRAKVQEFLQLYGSSGHARGEVLLVEHMT